MSIFLINPFILVAPIPAITREFFSAGYNAARVTTTSTAYSAVSSVSTTELSATNYAAFWQGTIDNSTTNSDTRAQLFETSVRQLSNIESQDATDAHSVGGMFPYAGGTNKTVEIQYSAEGGTAGIAGRALNVLTLDSSDKYAYNSGTTNATGNAVSVTITEPGDYIVIGSGMLGASDNAGIFDGTNTYGAVGVSMGQDATTFSPFWHVVRLNGLTNETLSVRVTLGTIRQTSILALKVDKFENVYYAEQTAQSTTTSNSFTTAFSNVFNIINPGNYHLILGSAQLQSSSTSLSAIARLANISRSINYNINHFRENNATTEWYPTVVARITSFASASPEIGWEFYSESTNTARLREMSIAILDLGIPAPPIAYVGSTSIVNSSNLTINDQVEPGDMVIVASHSTSTAVATPTGYTNGDNGTLNTVNYQWSYKFMGDPADTTITGLTAGADVKHIAMVFRDINSTSPFYTTPVTTTGGTGAPDPGSVTVNDATPLVMVAIGFLDDDNIAADVTPPDGYTITAVEQSSGTIMGTYKRIDQGSGTNSTEDPTAFGIGAGTDAWVAVTIPLVQI